MGYWHVWLDPDARTSLDRGGCDVIALATSFGHSRALIECEKPAADRLRGELGIRSVLPAEGGPYVDADRSGITYRVSRGGTHCEPDAR